jgi:hypothetical protein
LKGICYPGFKWPYFPSPPIPAAGYLKRLQVALAPVAGPRGRLRQLKWILSTSRSDLTNHISNTSHLTATLSPTTHPRGDRDGVEPCGKSLVLQGMSPCAFSDDKPVRQSALCQPPIRPGRSHDTLPGPLLGNHQQQTRPKQAKPR